MKKPAREYKCEAGTGSGSDSCGKPVFYSCQKPTTKTYQQKCNGLPVALCEEHAAYFKEKGHI